MKKRLVTSSMLALAMLAGCATTPKLRSPGTAIVRAIHGDVTCTIDGKTEPLRPNEALISGSTVRTGGDSYADLSVNGRTSTVRLTRDTAVTLVLMDILGEGPDADTQTKINLLSGTILGSVKKITGDSSYEVITPNSVAHIRGADYQVPVEILRGGAPRVTYTCVSGRLVVTSPEGNGDITKTLNTGDTWTFGVGEPIHIKPVFGPGMVIMNDSGGIVTIGEQNSSPPTPPILQPFNGNGPPVIPPSHR